MKKNSDFLKENENLGFFGKKILKKKIQKKIQFVFLRQENSFKFQKGKRFAHH